MSRTYTEQIGMAQAVLALLLEPDLRAKLAAKGFDVEPHVERLTLKQKSASKLTADQKGIKNASRRKTLEFKEIMLDLDTDVSGIIDAMCGVLGKNSPEAKNLQKVRSRIRVPRLDQDKPGPDEPKKAA